MNRGLNPRVTYLADGWNSDDCTKRDLVVKFEHIIFRSPRKHVDPEKSIDKLYASSDDSGIYCGYLTRQDVLPQVGCLLDSIVVFNSLAWSLSSNIHYSCKDCSRETRPFE